ncbi:hypothetical protein L596_021817 [Steinernema carpocapsae]|uniref:TILa domain-containing protein n=1 Tax=Steinernema carpocapsae TaxID=34508 RepID=A0A4U5MK82_STECR|nr:hypothetical protein L596_021817 [Steinernema carpocapsae]
MVLSAPTLILVFATLGCFANGKVEKPPCIDEFGKSHPWAVSWVSHACTRKNVCLNGQIYHQPVKCPENSVCKNDGIESECVCNNGLFMLGRYRECVKELPPAKPTQSHFCTDKTGKKFKNQEDKWISDNCTKTNICYRGSIYSESMECPKNGVCNSENDQMRCECQEGLTMVEDTWCLKIRDM